MLIVVSYFKLDRLLNHNRKLTFVYSTLCSLSNSNIYTNTTLKINTITIRHAFFFGGQSYKPLTFTDPIKPA